VDPAFLEDATEIATQLILDLCGGEASELIVAGSEPEWKRSYLLRDTRVKELGGVEVAPDRTQEILEILGFDVTKADGGWDTIAPSWRYDVVGEADLVEEVLRINGFDEIPIVPLERETALPHGAINLIQDRRSRVRRSLATRGMTEAVTFSFVAPNQADLFGGVPESIHLVNPISTDLAIMRPSILPNLIAAAGRNADRGISDVALFELGPQFAGENPDDETIVAAGLRVGSATPRNWAGKAREVDVFDVKADVLAALEQIGGPAANAQIAQGGPQWYHPGRSGTVQLGPKSQLAHFGEIHPAILKAMDVEGPVVGFEIYLDNAPMPKAGKGATRSKLDLHELQAVERDFAFIVEDKVSAEDLVRSAASADKKLIADVTVFDVFTGGNLDAHQMSVGLSVTLQPTEATLTDAEIEAVSDKVVANVAKQTGGILRG
ncbi:MAG: phenylalanine--tRNA ligase subunit beta, partial [Rhodospirillaceae bacterium]|nr:phenylalanine--tRNA ligase subunit beta [Rhodospirillaceae bacterium]